MEGRTALVAELPAKGLRQVRGLDASFKSIEDELELYSSDSSSEAFIL